MTSWSFPSGDPFGDGLVDILLWPKALEVFELRHPSDRYKVVTRKLLSPRRLADVLTCQQRSLREPCITAYPHKRAMTEIDDATLGDLHNFGALSRLCMPKHLLIGLQDIFQGGPNAMEHLGKFTSIG